MRRIAFWVAGILLTATLATGATGASGAAGPAAQFGISISREGEAFIVDAVLLAPVTRREAWEVLTDFDRMSGFLPSISESRVLRRAGNHLTVMQKGVVRFGILGFPFESLREVELQGEETVRTRSIGGNLRRLDSFTRFSDAGGGTRISFRVEVIPDFWVPGFLAEYFIRSAMEQQFEAILAELLRRRARR